MAKKKRRLKSKKSMRLKLKPATIYSIIQISFFSLAGLIVVSFTRQGLILEMINDFVLNIFSWTAIFLPFIFLSSGFLVSKSKHFLSQPNVLVGSILSFFSLVGLSRAGLLGQSSWDGLVTLVYGAGAFIIFLATFVIGIVVMFNTSLDHLMNLVVTLFRKYGVRGQSQIKDAGRKFTLPSRGELKVFGGATPNMGAARVSPPEPQKPLNTAKEPLEQKLVSNIPGEDKIWKYPPLDLLSDSGTGKADRGDIKGNAAIIEQTLESFGITARVVEVNLGPAVTQYAIEVALGTKLSKITALERDLALALAAPTGTIRIEAPIPGRSMVGIELPNRAPEFVALRKLFDSPELKNNTHKLTVALGLDVSGKPIVANIGKMPHVLIAGQTGSGKSVMMNTFLASLLMRTSPSEVKLILVDPKRVEMTGYNGIPHLLAPVIVEPEKVVSALKWVMSEMDRRYKLFAQAGARNIDAYNEMSGFQALPYIVVVIDELADIMLFSPAEVEDAVTRIAQMSRATGIHMVLATQRPSVDVITGLIKANIPSRIAFAVSSQIDSRVILDGPGAEKLLGKGDMLYLPPESAKPMRIQGAFVSDKDVTSLVDYIKNLGVAPQYSDEVTSMPKSGSVGPGGIGGDIDDLFKQAVEIVCQYDRASASLLQRRLSVGYARAARIIDQLESSGVVGPADGSKPREVLVQNVQEYFASLEAANGEQAQA